MSTDKRKGFFSRVFRKVGETNEPDTVQTDIQQSTGVDQPAISEAVVDNPATSDPLPSEPPIAPDETAIETKTPSEVEHAAPATSPPVTSPLVEPEANVSQTNPEPQPVAQVEVETESETETHNEPEAQSQKKGWFSRLQSGLSKTSDRISGGIAGIFTQSKLDETSIQDLEDILIQSDLGVSTSTKITDRIAASRYDKDLKPEDIRAILAEEISTTLKPVAVPLVINKENKPYVIMMIGVNGAGKTTTIGKLASQFTTQGKKVLLVAGDTFRAAAVDQLDIWADRTGADFISRDIGADAASLAYDAIKSARKTNKDIVMIDTAGRLQNKATLMAELEKIIRVIKKLDATAPHSVILVLDATTGQNALNQVDVFLKQAGVTGIIMTKLDGTARGGILVAIAEKYQLPIHAIGVGEQIEDLQAFDPEDFASAIANN